MTDAGRTVPNRNVFAARPRLTVFLAVLILLIGGASLGYYLGKKLASRPLALASERVGQLQPENQRLKKAIADQNAELASWQAKVAELEARWNAMVPAKDTFVLTPNQSLIVANGRMTLGLVGPPGNSSITININGKQQAAAPGDVMKVAPDCEVRVQSFDMFKALVTAACASGK